MADDDLAETLRFEESGLIPAIAQDHLTGRIRMVAYMNADALQATVDSGFATFFSRSRHRLWRKGETSGHQLLVKRITTDCDRDVLLLSVDPQGPSCHTGQVSCFFQPIGRDSDVADADPLGAAPLLDQLEATIERRRNATADKSYTKSLLEGGASKVSAKLDEEAAELCDAIKHESDERVVSEAADLLFHTLVALAHRGLSYRDVLEELSRRQGTGGHQEKASRSSAASKG